MHSVHRSSSDRSRVWLQLHHTRLRSMQVCATAWPHRFKLRGCKATCEQQRPGCQQYPDDLHWWSKCIALCTVTKDPSVASDGNSCDAYALHVACLSAVVCVRREKCDGHLTTTCSCTARAALGWLAGRFHFLQMEANSMGVKSMQRMHVRGRLDSKVIRGL